MFNLSTIVDEANRFKIITFDRFDKYVITYLFMYCADDIASSMLWKHRKKIDLKCDDFYGCWKRIELLNRYPIILERKLMQKGIIYNIAKIIVKYL